MRGFRSRCAIDPGGNPFTSAYFQVFFQLRPERGRQSQLPLQAVGGARPEWRSHIQSHSAAQPPWFHTKHNHRQVQPPVLPALRDPMWPARTERPGILLCCLFSFWKCAGTVLCLSNDICKPKVASPSWLLPRVSSHSLPISPSRLTLQLLATKVSRGKVRATADVVKIAAASVHLVFSVRQGYRCWSFTLKIINMFLSSRLDLPGAHRWVDTMM